jgi:hypothetical protein
MSVSAKMQRIDADVAGQRQPPGLGRAHQRHARGAGDAAQVHAGAGALHELHDGEDGDGLGRHGHAREAQARGQRTAGGHALAQVAVLRAQPHGVAEGAGVEQRALQHLRVGQRHVGLAEADAAGFGELGHLGEHAASEVARERAQRKEARALQLLGAELEHFDQARLVEHGVGVGRAHQAGHAARDGRGHFALQHAFVFVARLAQARGEVHEARRDDAARGVDGAVGLEAGGQAADAGDLAVGDGDVGLLVGARCGVDDAAVGDKDVHASVLPVAVRAFSGNAVEPASPGHWCCPR